MKLTISNIDWFAPGASKGMLPEQVVVEDQALLPHLLEDIDEDAANIAEWLSQEYGCLVNGFTTDIEGGNKT